MREIKGYEGYYSINENAEIINIKTNTTKRPTLGNHGYYVIDLFKNGKRKTFLVHRLMAETFLPNPLRKKTVNHKDGNKQNNKLGNLEWATYSENHKHSYEKLGRKPYMTGRRGKLNHNSKPVFMCSLYGEIIERFDSISDAERETGNLNNAIVACLKGKNKTCGGYKWRYAHDKDN